MKSLYYYFIAFALMFFSNCGGESWENIIEVNKDQFPVKLQLNHDDSHTLPINSFGISEIRVIDSLLIVSVIDNEEFWHIYSLPDTDSIGRFLNVGNAPYETPMPIPCYQTSFSKEGADIMTFIPLPEKHKTMKINLSRLITNNNYEENVTLLDLKSDNMTVWTFSLDNERYLQAVVDPINNRINRVVRKYSNNNEYDFENKYIEKLNSKNVKDLDDIQTLLTAPVIKPDGKMIAEIPGYSNQIFIYGTNSNNGYRIEYKDMHKDAQEVDQLARKFISMFCGGYGYNDYFTLIRNNIGNGVIMDQSIDFFSWDGHPIGTIELTMNSIRRFDIDKRNGILLCLDSETDSVLSFDISSFLNDIKTR